MGLKIINICPTFLLAYIPSQNPFAIGCKRLLPTVEIRRTVGECLQTFATVSLYWMQGWSQDHKNCQNSVDNYFLFTCCWPLCKSVNKIHWLYFSLTLYHFTVQSRLLMTLMKSLLKTLLEEGKKKGSLKLLFIKVSSRHFLLLPQCCQKPS